MGKLTKEGLRKIAVLSLGVYILIYYGIVFFLPNIQSGYAQVASDLFSMVGEIASVMIIIFGLQWQAARNRIEWKLFSLGIGMNFIGDALWSGYEIIVQKEVPFPSICDVFYLGGSIFYLIALIFYIRHEKLFDVVRTGFDIVITMVVSTTMLFHYIMLPIWTDNTLTIAQKSISMAYPILDLGYLGGIISLFFFCTKKTKLYKADAIISLAFLIWFIADVIYAVMSVSSYISGGTLDPLWPIGCWLIAVAVLFPSDEKDSIITEKEKNIRSRKWLIREYIIFLFPYVGVSMIIMLVSAKYILRDPLITGTVITVMLIMIRQIFSLLENNRLISMIHQSNQLLEESKSELEEQNIHLQKLNYLKEREANTDFLTGIYNRRYINDTLKVFPKGHSFDENLEISVLLIDIDHYKQINDKWGHKMGDMVLQQIAYLIKSSIRTEDVAGRFGGDEFLVIMPNSNVQVAEGIAERLRRRAFEEEFNTSEDSLKVTLSIGCARWSGFPKDYHVGEIVAAADKALYQAKTDGRNQLKIENLSIIET